MTEEVKVGEVWEHNTDPYWHRVLGVEGDWCWVKRRESVPMSVKISWLMKYHAKVLEADGTPVSAHETSKDLRVYAIDWDGPVGPDFANGTHSFFLCNAMVGITKDMAGRTLVGYEYPWASCPQRDPCRFAFKEGRVAQVDRATHAVFERLSPNGETVKQGGE
jgi:hypothetical protein